MLKTLLKIRFEALRHSMFRSGRNNKKRGVAGKLGFGVLMLYVLACFFIMFGMLFYSLCRPLGELNLQWFYFAIAAILAFMLSFIGNIFATQSQLYDAKDNELLLSMPIAPKFILGSRILSLLGMDLLYESLVMLPAAVVYCMTYRVTTLGVIFFIIEFLLLPFLVQAFSCVFAWVISLIGNRMRNKSAISMVLSVAFLCAYFYGYSQIQNIIQNLISNGTEIAIAVKRAAFPAYYFGVAITEHNLTYLLLFTVCVLVVFELVYFILSRSFTKITTTKRGAAKIRYQEKALRVSSQRKALLKKDLRHFWSNSMYVLNAGLGEILLIILSVIMLFKRDMLLQLFTISPGMSTFLGPLLCVALCGISTTVLIAAPSISLEGKNLWIAQSSPIDPKDILLAKADMQLVLCLPVTLFASLVFAYSFALSGAMIFFILVLPAVFNVFLALMGVTVSLRHPKFDYINETIAVKQGISTMICMFVGFGAVLIPALLYAFLFSSIMPQNLFLLLCILLFGVLSTVLYHYLTHGARKRFAALQP